MRSHRTIGATLLVALLTACALPGSGTGSQAADPRANLSPEEARALVGQIRPGRALETTWPNGAKFAVAFTFDVDGELAWMHEANPASIARGHYGIRRGLLRILHFLERHRIPATFFLPALILELHPDVLDAIRSNGRHEIGYHGYGHESPAALTAEEEADAMRRGLAIFARAGLDPQAYRAPGWALGPATIPLLVEHGFAVDSSLMADDWPYEVLHEGRPAGIVELPVDWSLDDWPYFQLDWTVPLPGLRNPDDVLAIWASELDAVAAEGGVFVLTLHPQVIGRRHRMPVLEALVDQARKRGAWFATVSGIAGALRAREEEPAQEEVSESEIIRLTPPEGSLR